MLLTSKTQLCLYKVRVSDLSFPRTTPRMQPALGSHFPSSESEMFYKYLLNEGMSEWHLTSLGKALNPKATSLSFCNETLPWDISNTNRTLSQSSQRFKSFGARNPCFPVQKSLPDCMKLMGSLHFFLPMPWALSFTGLPTVRHKESRLKRSPTYIVC